jgi:hypothetical protein
LVCHVHEGAGRSQSLCEGLEFSEGVSPLFWQWFNKLRHLRLPFAAHALLAVLSLPLQPLLWRGPRGRWKSIWIQIRQSRLLYFYGGTQLSTQWFWLNWFPLALTVAICRLNRIPVYFGPQQYGPVNSTQAALLRWTVRWMVADVRSRNGNCLRVLPAGGAALYDEVFSCEARYPIVTTPRREGAFLLFNVRGTDFSNDQQRVELFGWVDLLLALRDRLKRPVKFFQMSGESFCDDLQFFRSLSSEVRQRLDIEVVPPCGDRELIALSGSAYGTLSMSFHGCILSMLAGCPAVPLSSGAYYEYKYADFDKYSGGQGVPVLKLGSLTIPEDADRVVGYFERYDPARTSAARGTAAAAIDRWYGSIAPRQPSSDQPR